MRKGGQVVGRKVKEEKGKEEKGKESRNTKGEEDNEEGVSGRVWITSSNL